MNAVTHAALLEGLPSSTRPRTATTRCRERGEPEAQGESRELLPAVLVPQGGAEEGPRGLFGGALVLRVLDDVAARATWILRRSCLPAPRTPGRRTPPQPWPHAAQG